MDFVINLLWLLGSVLVVAGVVLAFRQHRTGSLPPVIGGGGESPTPPLDPPREQ